MQNSERLIALEPEQLREAILKPRRAGEPTLRLHRENKIYTASFDLQLEASSRPTDKTTEAAHTGFWLPTPAHGQALEITQRLIDGQLCCSLRGTVSGTRIEQIQGAARELWHNLEIALGSQTCYRFKPQEPIAHPRNFGWQVGLQPEGFALHTSRPIGFQATLGEQQPGIVLAGPAPRPSPHCNALARVVDVFKKPVELSLRLHSFTLDDTARQKLRDLLRLGWIDEHNSVEEPGLREALRQEVTAWLRHTQGLRIECTVSADAPLPEALLRLIGRDMFGGRTTRMQVASAVTRNTLLDLSDAVPDGALPPPLLPDPARLWSQGLPTHHALRPRSLPSNGVLLGHIDTGHRQPVRLSDADRTRHSYILGATGTGKSTLLYNLIMQDIERGAGVCLIDPHGDLSQQVLASLPPQRLQDVIVIDPGDPERAIGLNFLEYSGPRPEARVNFLINEMIKIFDRLYNLAYTGGPIFEVYMRNALWLVMDNAIEGGTLMDVPLLFEDGDFRKYLLKNCRNRYTVDFWRKQAERTSGDVSLQNIAPYITSKLNQFTHNAVLRPIIGQAKSTLDFRRCMDENRIILVNLTKGLLGDLDMQLLGMLVVGKLFNAALSRTDIPIERRRPFFLYIDEAHNFTTDTVASLLAEARKFGLYLTLANQNLAQMNRYGLIDAILGNVGSLLLFRLGVVDAERMGVYMHPELQSIDLQDLPDHHVAARLLVHGRPTRPFLFKTLAADFAGVQSGNAQQSMQAILAKHRLSYTRAITEVEAELLANRSLRLGSDQQS